MTEKDILSSTYYDTIDIYRKTTAKDPTTKITVNTYALITSNVKCALSQKKMSIPKEKNMKNDIIYEPRVFLSPDTTVIKGDKLILTVGASSQVKTLYAGDPMVYISHQEIPCLIEERA
jgi:hypothetical protein